MSNSVQGIIALKSLTPLMLLIVITAIVIMINVLVVIWVLPKFQSPSYTQQQHLNEKDKN